jgi:hypothetical protein
VVIGCATVRAATCKWGVWFCISHIVEHREFGFGGKVHFYNELPCDPHTQPRPPTARGYHSYRWHGEGRVLIWPYFGPHTAVLRGSARGSSVHRGDTGGTDRRASSV